MTDDTRDDTALDALFAEARRQRPAPDLVQRVLRDAVAAQTAAAPPAGTRAASGGFWRNPPAVVAALGGWSGFGGVTAAGLVGLALGFWSPEAVDAISGGQLPGLVTETGWTPDLTALAWEDRDV